MCLCFFFAVFDIYHTTFRLEESDLATSLEVLLVLKDFLVEDEILAVNFINDSMVMILREVFIDVKSNSQ